MLKEKLTNSEIVEQFFDNASKNIKKKTKKKKFKLKTNDEIGKILDMFLNQELTQGKSGKYEIDGNNLVYRSIVTKDITLNSNQLANAINAIKAGQMVLVDKTLDSLEKDLSRMVNEELTNQNSTGGWNHSPSTSLKVKVKQQDIVALRLSRNGETIFVGNSSVLGLIGRFVSFGNERLNQNETDIQRQLSLLIPMLPFSVFAQAKLDINTMEIIERGQAETITRKVFVKHDYKKKVDVYKDETRHFTGASLFNVQGNTFLFDLDRRELEHKIFNPFLVKLTTNSKTIKEAYESLKPIEVKVAEKEGLEVLRQGEWFFIPVKGEYQPDTRRGWTGEPNTTIELRAGNNRPNRVEMGVAKESLCKGQVTHSGREHEPLMLKQWYKAVPNTATKSFTITGDID